MKLNCKNSLLKFSKMGTKNERMLCYSLLKNSNFSKLDEIAKFHSVSKSSITRFIQKIGYPSFKHFIYDLNGKDSEIENNASFNEMYFSEIILKNMGEKEFYIICSRRSKGIAKFFREQLNMLGKPTNYFHEYNDDMESFLKNIKKNDNLILISLSGWSNTVSKGIQELAKVDNDNKPRTFIFSAKKWTKEIDKYKYIWWINFREQYVNLNSLISYNLVALYFLKIIISFSEKYLSVNKNK